MRLAAGLLQGVRGLWGVEVRLPHLTDVERRERRRRRAFEAAKHGLRARNKIAEEATYIESWAEFSARRKAERAAQ